MKKILVVEDESAYMKLLHNQLMAKGYEVIDAKDGWEGLKLATSKRPDLILLDLIMPNFNGLKMLTILRSYSWGKTLPVFVLTNAVEPNVKSEVMDNKATKYIIKSDLKLKNLLKDIEILLQGGEKYAKNIDS